MIADKARAFATMFSALFCSSLFVASATSLPLPL
jgi:hypothetical protein